MTGSNCKLIAVDVMVLHVSHTWRGLKVTLLLLYPVTMHHVTMMIIGCTLLIIAYVRAMLNTLYWLTLYHVLLIPA